MCVFVVLDWLLSAAMTLHCRMVCRFPLGVFKLRVDMTSKALLGGSESADFVRSMWKRCCLSHFKISTSAPGLCLSIWIFNGEVIWIVLVLNVMTADFC